MILVISNPEPQPFQIHNYWENAISHFTTMVYAVAIQVACSGGDPAPLVGHNVFLRWSAMKVKHVSSRHGRHKKRDIAVDLNI